MKRYSLKFLILLALIGLSQPTLANEFDAVCGEVDCQTSAVKTLLSVRDILENRKHGLLGLNISVKVLESLLEQVEAGEPSDPLFEYCETQRKLLRPTRMSPELVLERLQTMDVSERVEDIVMNFVAPSADCEQGALNGAIGAIVAADAKLSLAKCRASNGRRWWQASVGGGVGLGFGMNVTGGGKDYQMPAEDYRNSILGVSASQRAHLGAIVGHTREWTGDGEEGERSSSWGIGSVAAFTLGGQLDGKVMKLPDDLGYLYETYLAP